MAFIFIHLFIIVTNYLFVPSPRPTLATMCGKLRSLSSPRETHMPRRQGSGLVSIESIMCMTGLVMFIITRESIT